MRKIRGASWGWSKLRIVAEELQAVAEFQIVTELSDYAAFKNFLQLYNFLKTSRNFLKL
jgi:hypothetical protein